MHPVLDARRHTLAYLFVWLLFGVLLSFGVEGGTPSVAGLAVFVPLCAIYGLVCLSAWYLCRAFPLEASTSIWKALPAHALTSVLASGLWGLLTTGWARTVDTIGLGPGAETLVADRGPVLFVLGVVFYWLAASFHYVLVAFEASREAERRALEPELKALRAQIDPHFIFNSLHSISALTTTDPVAARRMCLLLADFLRET